MSSSLRTLLLCAIGILGSAQVGCNAVPQSRLSQSQNRARQLYEQNQALASDRQNIHNSASSLSGQLQHLQQKNASLQSNMQTNKDLLANANRERDQLRNRYASLLESTRNAASPLSAESTRQFEDLARRYPNFEFDPQTGVSKFHDDVNFSSGSDQVQQKDKQLLKEFTQILKQGSARDLNILIVGHTDNRRIAKASTKAKHRSNMLLSAHRANSVLESLEKAGLKNDRMGIAGYGPYQPLVANKDSKSRKKNRRVEIFVLAPNAPIAGLDSGARTR